MELSDQTLLRVRGVIGDSLAGGGLKLYTTPPGALEVTPGTSIMTRAAPACVWSLPDPAGEIAAVPIDGEWFFLWDAYVPQEALATRSGTALWAEIEDATGEAIGTLSVGGVESGADLEVDPLDLVSGQLVLLASLRI